MFVSQKNKQPDSPASNLQSRHDDSDYKTNLGPVHNTARRIPMAYGYKESRWRSEDGDAPEHQRIKCQRQRDVIVERALVFDALDFAFGAASFQAGGAK